MRFFWISVFVSCCFLQTSCHQEMDVVPEEKIVDVLADLLIADEIIANSHHNEREYYRNYVKKQILVIHGLEESLFDTTFTEIQKDLKNYYKIQNKVEERLKQMRDGSATK